MQTTPFAGLTVVEPDESYYEDGNSFGVRNPRIIDYLLRLGAKTHRHTGLPGLSTPASAPNVTLTTGGFLPSEQSYIIGYTLVDADGGETALSPVASGVTPAGIPAPTTAPTISIASGGGLPLGQVYYAVSRLDDIGGETPIGPSIAASVSRPSTITLGNLDAVRGPDADHLGIYKSVGGVFYWIGVAYGNTFVDDGTPCADCTREPVAQNSTHTEWAFDIDVPAASGATAVRIYAALENLGISDPSLLVELASGSTHFQMTNTQYLPGSPPPVNLSKGGANLIDPDSELLDWHWKRAVTASGDLPAGERGDVRIVLTPSPELYTVPSASAAGPLDWFPLALVGPAGPQGPLGPIGLPGPTLNYRGHWAASAAYDQYDYVEEFGSSYWATVDISPFSDAPVENSDWALLASAGARGPQGSGLNWAGGYSGVKYYEDQDLVSAYGNLYVSNGLVGPGDDPASGGVRVLGRTMMPLHPDVWNDGEIIAGVTPTFLPFSASPTQGWYFDVLASGHVLLECPQLGTGVVSMSLWNSTLTSTYPIGGVNLAAGRYYLFVSSSLSDAPYALRVTSTAALDSGTGFWDLVYASGAGGGGGGDGHVIEDHGSPMTARGSLNFAGAGVTVVDDGVNDRTTVTIASAGGGGGGSASVLVIEDNGVTFPVRGALNFIGADSIVDDSAHDRTNVTLASGGGGGGSIPSYEERVTRDGAVLYLPLQADGDDILNSISGTDTGTPSYGDPGGPFGDLCTGFDGASYISLTGVSTLMGSGPWTLEAWVRRDDEPAYGPFFKFGDSSTGLGMGFGSTTFDPGNAGDFLTALAEQIAWVTSGADPELVTELSKWHHVALAEAGNTMYMYLDGFMYVVSRSINSPSDNLGVGGYAARFLLGSMAHFAAYPRLLRRSELLDHANYKYMTD